MWTKLLWASFPTAITPKIIRGQYFGPLLSNRYKAILKKQFRIVGMPWIFEKLSEKVNQRHRRPKGTKEERERPLRIAKIKKNLDMNAEAELKYRQERLNNKKLSGLDYVFKMTLPSWISQRNAEQLKKEKGGKGGLVQLEGSKRSGYGQRKK